MDIYDIYCTGCDTIIATAYAKSDSDVARGRIKDEYHCANCARRDTEKRQLEKAARFLS